ncbi:MAG: ABC transporter substrate-binding protein [Planctomycetes bacterium]|nr:ABC transporter substrate-binding protein [Planctomycetota bacterium]
MKKEKNNLFTLAAICLLLIITTLICVSCRKSKPNDLTKVVIAQWGQEKYLIYLPLYVAIEKDFFSAQGLDINLKFSGNDDQVFASVIQGTANFGIGDPVFTAIANEREPGIGKVVASIVDGVAIWGVTNRQDIPVITSKQDLSNLRIGTFPSPSTNYALMNETIISGGKKLESTKIVQAPIGSQIALLEKGLVDIAMVLEPSASKAESEGYRIVFSSPKFYGSFAFTGLTTSGDFNSKHPQIVQSMVNGLQEAMIYCHSHPKEVIEIAEKLFPSLDTVVLKKAVNRMLQEKTFPTSVMVSENSWRSAISTRVAVGDLKETQDYSKSVDITYANKAIAEIP